MSLTRLLKWDAIKSILADILSVLGLFGVIVAVTGFFTSLNNINESLKTNVVLGILGMFSVAFSLKKNWPKSCYEYKLNGKDIRIRLVIGDIFEETGAIIVPINSSFDVDLGGTVLKTNSIQAQVIKKYYDSKMNGLQKSLNNKSPGNPPCKIGTTVPIEKNGKKFYFLASSRKISEEKVETDKDMLTEALIGLWVYLSRFGSKEVIVVPLIGTGNARISSTRRSVFKEILQSFIASCHERTYCDKLVVVVNSADVHKYEIDIDELDEFLRFSCKYFDFQKQPSPPVGTPAA